MRIASLGSGSRGNATLVSIDAGANAGANAGADAGTQSTAGAVLVDCGFSLREMKRRAREKQFDLGEIRAILVTHEHSDHCSGVAALSRHLQAPVYLTHGTAATGRVDGCFDTCTFNAGDSLQLAGMSVSAVAVPHDAREPVQYVFQHGAQRIGVLTDLGSITAHVTEAFADCDALLLEFNHDSDLLAIGPYPATLKRRVGGDWGHLSNRQAVELLQRLNHQRLQRVVIAHTSDKNNRQECVESAIAASLPSLLPRVVWASQEAGFEWIELHAAVQNVFEPLPDKTVDHWHQRQASGHTRFAVEP
ncbi:MAG: MBL fold metallo-hydrolase [Congregibacter sp.]